MRLARTLHNSDARTHALEIVRGRPIFGHSGADDAGARSLRGRGTCTGRSHAKTTTIAAAAAAAAATTKLMVLRLEAEAAQSLGRMECH